MEPPFPRFFLNKGLYKYIILYIITPNRDNAPYYARQISTIFTKYELPHGL